MLNYDVAVIGGGMAGAVAALSARRRGAKVLLIAKGSGASTLSGGALDVCGSPISAPGIAWSRFLSVKENIFETIARMPHHPYSVLALNNPDDAAGGLMEMLGEAFGFVKGELARAGLHLNGDVARQRPAPTMLGTWKLTSFAQSTQQLGVPEGDAAVMGIKGLSAPTADSLAASLQITLAAVGLGAGETIDSFEIELDGRDTWTMEEAAEELERPGSMEKFLHAIFEAGAPKYRVVLIPPIIPFISKTIKPPVLQPVPAGEETPIMEIRLPGGTVLREMLAMPPSTPGRRLKDALTIALEAAGVVTVHGEALEFERNGSTLVSCSVLIDGAPKRVKADSWVLASGKFIGGGLRKEQGFREAALNLPVYCGDKQVDDIFTQKLLRTQVLADHPLFGVGLMTDQRLRPVDPDGKAVMVNLFAAGGILGGYNYHTGACGMGVCVLTGHRAGREAFGDGK